MKRTRIKRNRSKYPGMVRLIARQRWAAQHPTCWVCCYQFGDHLPEPGARWQEIHEIVRRSHAAGQWAIPENYFSTCDVCHAAILASMPLAEQLAYKFLHDRANYNRVLLLDIKGLAETAVTEKEVGFALEQITESEIFKPTEGQRVAGRLFKEASILSGKLPDNERHRFWTLIYYRVAEALHWNVPDRE